MGRSGPQSIPLALLTQRMPFTRLEGDTWIFSKLTEFFLLPLFPAKDLEPSFFRLSLL